MYQSCLVCRSDLGRNDEIERFPVSRHVAFSPGEGRLWAICGRCGEWNLAPIAARWEAVAECDALYENATRRRAAAELALAEVGDLRLLRVGHRSDLPTLRYASRLRKRSRAEKWLRHSRRIGDTAVVLAIAVVGAATVGIGGFFVGWFLAAVGMGLYRARSGRLVAEVRGADGGVIQVTERDLRDARLVPVFPDSDSGWRLRIRKGVELDGGSAVEAVRMLTPLLNRSDEPGELVRKALRYIEKKGGTMDSVFSAAARRRGRRRTARLSKLDPHIRLALEVLAGAESEARALSSDLAPLLLAWKDADELAQIQDDLAFELGVVERIANTE
jgi:hypothetical protein